MESIGLTAGTKILNHITDDLYDFIKDKAGQRIKKSIIVAKLPSLFSKIDSVRKVKTLWQLDQAVDIESFYCDSHLLFANKKVKKKKIRKRIDDVSDISIKHNAVIRGIAGQGKSILLRHLCAREFEAGQRIPVFIELRRIQNNETLLEHINRFLDILEIPIDEALFKLLSKSGRFIFFFDGFDEIPEERRPRIVNELEHLASCATGSQFIVSTRPNTAIEMSPFFDVYTLDDLRGNEYRRLIQKLTESPEYASNLIKAIESHRAKVSELLCTPLLVTLLLISYKLYQKLPEQLSDFYDSIFVILLQRHDGTKPGFVRPRRCSINDNQYRQIFDAFCFESEREVSYPLDHKKVYKLIQAAMELSDIKEDPERYLNDIKQVTCLLLQEGEEYRFIHKSVQEYYAASFIKSRPDTNAINFFTACLDYRIYRNWQQELLFLSEIDVYRYYKHYLLPLCRRWLDIGSDTKLAKSQPPLTRKRIIKLIGHFKLSSDAGKSGKLFGLAIGSLTQVLGEKYPSSALIGKILDTLFGIDYHEPWSRLSPGEIVVNYDYFEKYGHPISKITRSANHLQYASITAHQLIEEGFLPKEFEGLARLIAEYIYGKWKGAYDYVRKRDSFNIASQMNI